MEKIQEISYLDIGFNAFGLNLPIGNRFMSANMNDAFFELSEFSVRSLNLQGSSVETSKIQDLAVTNAKIQNVSADKITAGTLAAVTNVGDESIVLDGENKVIKIYDDSDNVSVYIAGGAA